MLEEQTSAKLHDFLEMGTSGDRTSLTGKTRREYYSQSKSFPLQVICWRLRKSPMLEDLCLGRPAPSRAGPGQATRPAHGSHNLRFPFETAVQSVSIELRLCQTIKNKLLDISLEQLPKMNLQIFRWESQRGSNFVIFWSWALLVTGAIWPKIPAGSITYRVSPLLCKLCV